MSVVDICRCASMVFVVVVENGNTDTKTLMNGDGFFNVLEFFLSIEQPRGDRFTVHVYSILTMCL